MSSVFNYNLNKFNFNSRYYLYKIKKKINQEDRKYCFEIFGYDFIIDEDFNLWLQLAKNGIRFKYMPLALGTYFLGTENLSFNDENRIFRYKYLFKKIIDSEENSHTKKKLSATLNYYISWIYFNNRNFKKAILPTIHSLCYGSISIKLAVFRSVLKALIKV